MERSEMLCNNREVMTELLEQFLSDKPKKTVFGNFRIENSRIVYRCQSQEEKWIHDKKLWDLLMRREKNGEIKMISAPRRNDKGEIDFTYAFSVKYQETEEEIVAQKFSPKGETPFVLGNSTILRLVGKTVSYGNVNYNRSVTLIQQLMEQNSKIYIVPFSVFTELNLDINKARVVECGCPEIVERKIHDHWDYNDENRERTQVFRMENAHFSGSVLFRVGDTHILVDLDRRELQFGTWNAFAVVLPRPAMSIADAYDSLMPNSVKAAIRDGKSVKRIGEWFMIPCKAPKLRKYNEVEKALLLFDGMLSDVEVKALVSAFGSKWVKSAESRAKSLRLTIPWRATLQAGGNTPNHADVGIQIGKVFYVKGKVTHQGRAHEPLLLKDWHMAVCNRAHKSYQLTGDLD